MVLRRVLPAATALGVMAALTAAAPTWTPQLTGVNARLRGISAVSEKVVWASGSGGTVLRTTNGGDSWTVVPVPGAERLDFRDIDAVSNDTAYLLSIGNGELSRIYKTENAGATWTLQLANTDPKIFLDAMAFWSEDRGIAYSDAVDGRFVVFLTTNGRTWERVAADTLPPALPNEGAYAASGTNVAVRDNHVWIGTTASRVLHSPDRGRTWTVSQTPIPTSQSAGIFSIAFRDALHGIAVGGDYRKESEAVDNAAVTTDGGRTWTLSKGLSGYRSAVAHVPRSKGSWLAIGPLGADVSNDDGRTWKPMPGAGFDAFSFAPRSRIGWGAGQRGGIGRLDGF
ncbi:MAG TPA: YCF48-related protein [Vicinamibacterales bacterium]|nr:YCF48-related protein [Vicinamibacterales bacterium]